MWPIPEADIKPLPERLADDTDTRKYTSAHRR